MNATAVLDGPPQGGTQPMSTPQATWPRRACPECLVALDGLPGAGTIYCTEKHRRAWNNRWLKRGGVLAALYAASRATRDGTRGGPDQRAIGKRASADCALLHQQWKEEDERDGRMSALECIALRYRHGFVEVVR